DFRLLTHRCPTDLAFPSAADFQFTDEHRFLCGLGGLEFERVTQISQMTQIFLTYSVRLRRFFDSPALFPL
ncbi:MAG: hypothetical protein ACOCO9_04425, partial [Segatella copri]